MKIESKVQEKFGYFNPYPNSFFWTLDSLCLNFLRIGRIILDEMLSSTCPTTSHRMYFWRWILMRLLMLPFLVLGFLFSLPFVSFGWLVWLLIQRRKKPYRLYIGQPVQQMPPNSNKNTFNVATVNLCLLQKCLSQFNNQTAPFQRSRLQGARLAQQQLQTQSLSINTQINEVQHGVLQEFPYLDALLIQVL